MCANAMTAFLACLAVSVSAPTIAAGTGNVRICSANAITVSLAWTVLRRCVQTPAPGTGSAMARPENVLAARTSQAKPACCRAARTSAHIMVAVIKTGNATATTVGKRQTVQNKFVPRVARHSIVQATERAAKAICAAVWVDGVDQLVKNFRAPRHAICMVIV